MNKLSDWFKNIIGINRFVHHFANLFVDFLRTKSELERTNEIIIKRLELVTRKVNFFEQLFIQQQLSELEEALNQSVGGVETSTGTNKKTKKTVKKSNKKGKNK